MALRKSFLQLVNKTDQTLTIKAEVQDNFDWDGQSRPDHNFNQVTIPPLLSLKKREELNASASSAWFTMFLHFNNGEKISLQSNQYNAFYPSHHFFELEGSGKDKFLACQVNSGKDENNIIIYPFSLQNWMQHIPDDISILNLSIPGTHETCAIEGDAYGQCQDWDLRKQLKNGVRYLDIRGEALENGGAPFITIKHGAIPQPYDFNKVLEETVSFLKKNPSETVLLQLKQESSKWDGPDYASLVKSYILNSKYQDYFYLDQKNLNLGDIRGKIVLVNRFFDNSDMGVNVSDWEDDTYFSKYNRTLRYNVQDVYKVCRSTVGFSRDRKMDFVNLFFKDYATKKDQLNLCFCSAVCPPIVSPGDFAAGPNGINERTAKQHLQKIKEWNGVILLDFIDSYAQETIPNIIYKNLFQLKENGGVH